jgi:hypothetical protein
MRPRLAVLVALSASAVAQSAADEHEARAQQALADSLTDANAMMEHGSDSAKESAAEGVAQMAVETTISQPYHPVTFRNACVKAGVVERLIRLIDPAEGATPTAQKHALNALEAIATDDPTTDMDNGHARKVCELGACSHIVRLLSSQEEWLQVSAARCVAILAEDLRCQKELVKARAVDPLILLGTYGNDVAKAYAVAALDLLRLSNAQAHRHIVDKGGMQMLEGLKQYGFGEMRGIVSETIDSLQRPPSATGVASVDASGHVKQAHQQRLKHSKLWDSMGLRRAYAPQGQG